MADSSWLDQAKGMSPSESVSAGISGLILAFFGAFITLVEEAGQKVSEFFAVMEDFREFVATFFSGPETILSQTAQYSADSLTVGDWAFFGPATWVIGVLAVVGGFWVWTWLDPDIPIIDNLLPWR